ncbi:MAG: STAS domain-containing protein [bacterium]
MFNVKSHQVGGVTVIRVDGSIDFIHANALREHVDSLLNDNKRRIILDMGMVDHIDSSGLGALLNLCDRIQRVSGQFALANIGEKVKDTIQLAGVKNFVQIAETVDEGMKMV